MSTEIKITKLEDYRPPVYLIPNTKLAFDIYDENVVVTAELEFARNPDSSDAPNLVLDGERLKLLEVVLDGKLLNSDDYQVTDNGLTIPNVPDYFSLRTKVEIDPYHNTWLEGIYKSGHILCSQNEPNGFRKITYFADRPDVMSVFSVKISADAKRYPYLLSNGNCMEKGELCGGRHYAQWHDPFPKPCYLFAFVAGDFALTEDSFTTASGREVKLQIYVDHGNENRVGHTMASLKRAMRWDEETFGLEYDLDRFMIVAVDAFNMGAMENKGLNIFNSACALANPDTATDMDYQRVEEIVAHEYFHNWTGDRITLRDWFQLTLKEGLTVYRDGEYTADTYSRPIKRIDSAGVIRAVQFLEDAGPNAHPIKPKSYQEINNFYTSTVYQKGAEVIRMLEVLLGKDGFKRGMTRYVELFDGKAITTEDFLYAMESANDLQLEQFQRWYHQAGTPVCKVRGAYDSDAKTYTLTVRQNCAPTADGSPKEPFYIPLELGLLDENGHEIALSTDSTNEPNSDKPCVLILKEPEQHFIFKNIPSAPIPSLFRNFSAPVKVEYNYTHEELIFLLRNDTDSFNRYDAGQRLALDCILAMVAELQAGKDATIDDAVLDAFGALLADESQDPAYRARCLVLPPLSVINQELDVYDFEQTFRARETFKASLAQRHEKLFRRYYDEFSAETYSNDPISVARRAFRNMCLDYLSYLGEHATEMAATQFNVADNMTDRMAALRTLCIRDTESRDLALENFLERYKHDFNVVNKWFAVQCSAARNPNLYEHVVELSKHRLFDATNPNRLRSVYSAFISVAPAFHHPSGRGYKLVADIIKKIDGANSQMSAGLAKAFKDYAKMQEGNRKIMREELENILSCDHISTGLREIVSKTLAVE